jgi:hypothetical protein
MGWIVSFIIHVLKASGQFLRTWSHLEIVVVGVISSAEVIRMGPNPIDWLNMIGVIIRRENWVHTHAHRDRPMWRWKQRPGWCICKLRNAEASNLQKLGEQYGQILPFSTKKEPVLLTPWFGPVVSSTLRQQICWWRLWPMVLCHSCTSQWLQVQSRAESQVC